MNLLQAENLGRCDNGSWRLRQFELGIDAGEIVGLLGLNGAGKSTALALITGALAPSSGKVFVNGKDLHTNPVKLKRQIGFLPEKPALYPELTVDENLDFAARLYGIKAVAVARNKIKKKCSLEPVGSKLCRNLSRGFQQRAGIAQALIHDPEILVLDEPTAGLDPAHAAELRSLILASAPARAIIMASHILLDIEQMCQRILVLNQGRVVLDRSLQQENTQLVRLQLDKPPQKHDELCKLEGIESIQVQEDNWFLLETTGDTALVAQAIAREAWAMRAFVPVSLDVHTLITGLAESR